MFVFLGKPPAITFARLQKSRTAGGVLQRYSYYYLLISFLFLLGLRPCLLSLGNTETRFVLLSLTRSLRVLIPMVHQVQHGVVAEGAVPGDGAALSTFVNVQK